METVYPSTLVYTAYDLSYIGAVFRKYMLIDIGTGVSLLLIAACNRMGMRMKGRNGASMVLAALDLEIVSGSVCMWIEPVSKIVIDEQL